MITHTTAVQKLDKHYRDFVSIIDGNGDVKKLPKEAMGFKLQVLALVTKVNFAELFDKLNFSKDKLKHLLVGFIGRLNLEPERALNNQYFIKNCLLLELYSLGQIRYSYRGSHGHPWYFSDREFLYENNSRSSFAKLYTFLCRNNFSNQEFQFITDLIHKKDFWNFREIIKIHIMLKLPEEIRLDICNKYFSTDVIDFNTYRRLFTQKLSFNEFPRHLNLSLRQYSAQDYLKYSEKSLEEFNIIIKLRSAEELTVDIFEGRKSSAVISNRVQERMKSSVAKIPLARSTFNAVSAVAICFIVGVLECNISNSNTEMRNAVDNVSLFMPFIIAYLQMDSVLRQELGGVVMTKNLYSNFMLIALSYAATFIMNDFLYSNYIQCHPLPRAVDYLINQGTECERIEYNASNKVL